LDRSPRLRRYQKKDYSQTVEFPVEIVGRDNLVRRYPFDEAVRLYHRRIATAASRYEDPETVDAEIAHCGRRIEQLRRSYLERSGLGELADNSRSALLQSPMAADIAAFLRRTLASAGHGGGAIDLAFVDRAAGESFWVRGGVAPRGCMLYAYRLDGRDGPGPRAALEREFARLRAAAHEPGAERLYLAHLSPDLALVLAGTEPWSGPSGIVGQEVGEAPEVDDEDGLRAGLAALVEGRAVAALGLFEAEFERAPERSGVGNAVAVAGLLAGEPQRAEFAARYAALQHPGDALSTYLLAVSLLAQDRGAELETVLSRPNTRSASLAVLRGALALARGSLREGVALAREARSEATDTEWFAVRASKRMVAMARWFWFLRGCVMGSAVLGAVLAWFQPGALLLAPLALGLGAWVERGGRRALADALRDGRFRDVRLVSPEILPRDTDAPPRQ